jgi:hypothetical protein
MKSSQKDYRENLGFLIHIFIIIFHSLFLLYGGRGGYLKGGDDVIQYDSKIAFFELNCFKTNLF